MLGLKLNHVSKRGHRPQWAKPDQGPIQVNSLRPRPNRRHFADDIFKCIFFNENVWISIKISLKFVPKDPINNIPALVQIMAWRRPGDKPLSEPMMVSLTTHICVTRPQWVKQLCRNHKATTSGFTTGNLTRAVRHVEVVHNKNAMFLNWFLSTSLRNTNEYL